MLSNLCTVKTIGRNSQIGETSEARKDLFEKTDLNLLCFKCVLEDSHRHGAIDDLLELLNGYH